MFEYQNIIIAPDVFKYIKNSYSEPESEDVDLRSYKQNLKLKCLVLDKRADSTGLYTRLINMIQGSPDLAKNKLVIILNEFLLSNRVKFENTTTEEKFVENMEHNYLFNLALSSNTKIINSQLDILLYKNKIDKFEILNIEDFINPPSNSSLFSSSRDITLKKGDKFNIYEELRYYWVNTETLVIEDDYLRKEDSQFPKLIELIKCCKNLKKLEISSYLSDPKQKDYISKKSGRLIKFVPAKKFNDMIKANTRIQPIIIDKQVGERHYITDFFDIHFGKGLDFFNEKSGFKVGRDKVTISIRPRKDIEIN